MGQYGGFQGVAYISQGDRVLLDRGFGLADRANGTGWSSSTVSTIGSITKQFTGAAVVLLAQRGELDFDDTLAEFFPDVPEGKAEITVHQLLTHSAGFRPALGSDEQYLGRDDYLQRAWNSLLEFEPGTEFGYSNTGYSIAAAIVEVVSGQAYMDFLERNIFEPAGMHDTGTPVDFRDDSRLAIGYRGDGRWGTLAERWSGDEFTWHLMGNGGIHSTASDMQRWWRAIRDNTILDPEHTKVYLAPHQDEGSGDSFYSYGWVNFEMPDGQRMLSHNGGNTIYFADCAYFPETDTFAYLATNNAPGSTIDTFTIFQSLSGGDLSLPPDPATIDVAELEQIVLSRARAFIDALNNGPDAYVQYGLDHRIDRGEDARLNEERRESAAALAERFGELEVVTEGLVTPFQAEIGVVASASGQPMTVRVTLAGEPPYLVAEVGFERGRPGGEGGPDGGGPLDRARQLAQQGEFEESIALLERVGEQRPDDPEVWFLLGYVNLIADRNAEAIEPLEKARAMGFEVGTTCYNLACAYAKQGKSTAAIEAVEAAIEAGWSDTNALRADPDLASIQQEKRFVELLETLGG
jgi:CubicO group peptidase (beta-lactamase class C family)